MLRLSSKDEIVEGSEMTCVSSEGVCAATKQKRNSSPES